MPAVVHVHEPFAILAMARNARASWRRNQVCKQDARTLESDDVSDAKARQLAAEVVRLLSA